LLIQLKTYLRSLSIKISYPRSSKQLFLFGNFFKFWYIIESMDSKDLMMTSYIFDHIKFRSIPIYSRYFAKAARLHLWPVSSYSAFKFGIYFSFFLFIE
jgi:hypothetical protein